MRIQDATYEILKDTGKPMRSEHIAHLALEKNMCSSKARAPIKSLAQTIEKTIREGFYNNRKLIFINTPQGRLIGLPEWEFSISATNNNLMNFTELKVNIPVELMDKIKLAEQAKIKNDFDETVILILKTGLSSLIANIKNVLMKKLEL